MRSPALLVGVVLLASGCGGSPPAVSESASAALKADVADVQMAARAGNRPALDAAAAALREEVATQAAGGQVSVERAAAILDQLTRVLADAAVRPAPRATVPDRTAAPTSRPSERGKNEDKGEDDEKGKDD